MTYAIFLLVTAVCAFGLNYLTNKICSGTGMINQSGGSNVHAYGVSHRSSFSLSHSGFLSNLP